MADVVARGMAVGAIATLALEAFRYPGFRLGFMPGNLPRLMGVLLLDRYRVKRHRLTQSGANSAQL